MNLSITVPNITTNPLREYLKKSPKAIHRFPCDSFYEGSVSKTALIPIRNRSKDRRKVSIVPLPMED